MGSSKLFVGGLAWATTDTNLRKAFEVFGNVVDCKVITDRETGQSRGFGFVTFDDDRDASDAMTKMNGSLLDGRTIRVDESENKRAGNAPSGGSRNQQEWGNNPAPQVESRGSRRGGRGGEQW